MPVDVCQRAGDDMHVPAWTWHNIVEAYLQAVHPALLAIGVMTSRCGVQRMLQGVPSGA